MDVEISLNSSVLFFFLFVVFLIYRYKKKSYKYKDLGLPPKKVPMKEGVFSEEMLPMLMREGLLKECMCERCLELKNMVRNGLGKC